MNQNRILSQTIQNWIGRHNCVNQMTQNQKEERKERKETKHTVKGNTLLVCFPTAPQYNTSCVWWKGSMFHTRHLTPRGYTTYTMVGRDGYKNKHACNDGKKQWGCVRSRATAERPSEGRSGGVLRKWKHSQKADEKYTNEFVVIPQPTATWSVKRFTTSGAISREKY